MLFIGMKKYFKNKMSGGAWIIDKLLVNWYTIFSVFLGGKEDYFIKTITVEKQFEMISMLERVWKFIPAICVPHFAVYLRQIQST